MMPVRHVDNNSDVYRIGIIGVWRLESMRTNVDLDDALVQKAMELTKITTKKALINKALEELIKSNTRKGMLRYIDSGAWEGNLKEMRTTR